MVYYKEQKIMISVAKVLLVIGLVAVFPLTIFYILGGGRIRFEFNKIKPAKMDCGILDAENVYQEELKNVEIVSYEQIDNDHYYLILKNGDKIIMCMKQTFRVKPETVIEYVKYQKLLKWDINYAEFAEQKVLTQILLHIEIEKFSTVEKKKVGGKTVVRRKTYDKKYFKQSGS